MPAAIATRTAVSHPAHAAKLLNAIRKQRVYIGTVLDSNATQTSGSYWAGLRNGFRARGYGNWGSRIVQPTYGSWAALAPSSLTQMGQTANGGYIRLSPVNSPALSAVSSGAPPEIQAFQGFLAGTQAGSASGGYGGTPPAQTGITTSPEGFTFFIHGVESGKVCDVGNLRAFADYGIDASNDTEPLGTPGVDPIVLHGSYYNYDASGRVRGFIRNKASPFTRLATLDLPGQTTGWTDFTLAPTLAGAISGYNFICHTDNNSGGNLSLAQCFMEPCQWVRTDIAAGVAVGDFWAQGGQGLIEAAATIEYVKLNKPAALKEQLRCAVRSAPLTAHVCVWVKHGHNDVNDTTQDAIMPDGSAATGVKSNTAAGHTQNLETVLTAYREAWLDVCSDLGRADGPESFHCVSGGLHDAGSGYTAQFLGYYNSDAAWFSAHPEFNGFAINGNEFGTNAELNDAGYIEPARGQNHMANAGYTALGLWEVQCIEQAAQAAGTAKRAMLVGIFGHAM